jgi:glycyl-tRNA synthetase (class II)
MGINDNTLENEIITVRDRDTMVQVDIKINNLDNYLTEYYGLS